MTLNQEYDMIFVALSQMLGCDSVNHAPILVLELFLYLRYFSTFFV